MYIRAKSNALSYLALFNGDIFDVYDTYDEAVADLKSEIDYEIADGGVDNIDFGECWVETNDDAAEVVYIADGDDDYDQYVNASTNVRSKYVKADMEDFFNIGNDVDLDDMSAELERLRRTDLFKGRVPKKIQDRTIENMDVYHMGLADAFKEACRDLAPKGSELWKAWYYDDFRKFIPSAYLEEYLDFKKYPKKY